MRRISRRTGTCKILGLAIFVAAAVLGSAGRTCAQTDASASKTVRVKLGEDGMPPGFQVAVPLTFESGGLSVGKIEVAVTYPAAQVTFDSVRRGAVGEQIDAQIQHTIEKDATNPALSIVKITVAPKESSPIPEGPLLDFVFTISKDLSIGDPPIVLKSKPQAYSIAAPASPLPDVETKDGLIRIVAEPTPVLACFFFMH